jgi:hypothetical protein
MIAYALAMSFLDRLRNLLAGPPRVKGDATESAALREEFGAPDEGSADVRSVEGPGVGGGLHTTGFGGVEAAEAAEGDLSTEEAPPDPTS